MNRLALVATLLLALVARADTVLGPDADTYAMVAVVDSDTAGVWFFRDGDPVGEATSLSLCAWLDRIPADRSGVWKAQAYDHAGNVSELSNSIRVVDRRDWDNDGHLTLLDMSEAVKAIGQALGRASYRLEAETRRARVVLER